MFWEKFCNLCNLRNTNPNKVCSYLELSNATATKWKKAGAVPNGDTLIKIADYFGVSTDYLLGRIDEEELIFKSLIERLKKVLSQFPESDLLVDETGITAYGWQKIEEFVIKNFDEIKKGIIQLEEKENL